jgi:peptide/nickel transport system permease protein
VTSADGLVVEELAVEQLSGADLGTARRRHGLRRFFGIRSGLIGSVGVLVVVLLAIFGPLFAPYSPYAIGAPPALGPSSAHLLGTDLLGRDVWSRFLTGGISVIVLPLIAVSAALVIGCVMGLLSGYLGGRLDAAVTRVIDVVLALPPFLLVLVIIAGFGTGEVVIVVAVAAVYAPSIARVIRSATLSIRPREYVLAARARGDSLSWIVFREVAPNVVPTLLVEIALRLTFAIMFIASLSFLGLGVQPPSSNWGVMIAENRDLLLIHPLPVLVPAAAIALLTISINLIADALTTYFSVGQQGGAR